MNKTPFVREETCSCGASLRIEYKEFLPVEDRFIWWRENHRHDTRIHD